LLEDAYKPWLPYVDGDTVYVYNHVESKATGPDLCAQRSWEKNPSNFGSTFCVLPNQVTNSAVVATGATDRVGTARSVDPSWQNRVAAPFLFNDCAPFRVTQYASFSD